MKIKPDSIISVLEQGSHFPAIRRELSLADLPQPKKGRVVELLQQIMANPTPVPGGGTSNSYEVMLDGVVITTCPQFDSVPGLRPLANLVMLGQETLVGHKVVLKNHVSPPQR